MPRRPEDPESSANLIRVANTTNSDQEDAAEAWLRPIKDGQWIDDHGISWHIRGQEIEPAGPPLQRLLRRPELRVLHAYGPRPREVSGSEREALLERVGRFAAGEASAHSAFWLAEFRNGDRQIMLVIEEAC